MSNFREQFQNDVPQQRPQFLKKIDKKFEIKSDSNNKIGFSYYDSVQEENKIINKPFKGIILGQMMQSEVFDVNMNKNGGTLQTSLYNSYNDSGVVFGGGKKMFPPKGQASITECMDYMASESGSTVKKKRVYFVYSMESAKVYKINTNLVLAITQENNLDVKKFKSNHVKITPSLYNEDDFDAKTNKFLGKFATTNPPKYAKLEIAEPLSDEDFSNEQFEESYKEFVEWREYVTDKGNDGDDEVKNEAEDLTDLSQEEFEKRMKNSEKEKFEEKLEKNQASQDFQNTNDVSEEDDLPF